MSSESILQKSAVRSRPLQIVVSFMIRDPDFRARCEQIVAGQTDMPDLQKLCGPVHSYEANTENDPGHAAELLALMFEAPGRAVVVVSDRMADPLLPARGAVPAPTDWWQKLVDASPEDRLGSVAITPWAPRRLPDVDRVVSASFDRDALLDAIARAVRTLEYKQPPPSRPLRGETVVVRHIRTRDELRAYYQLRHRVYSVMGYLDHEVEWLPVGMEFDWCDRHAVHVGAFVEGADRRPRLVGTARLITPRVWHPDMNGFTTKFAEADGTCVLRGRFGTPTPFQMPFLQSHPDDEIVRELQIECPDAFCEISRVIVDYDYRGAGLSKLLVGYTLEVGRRMGMRRMFLECLPTHRQLYESFGFRVVPNRRQRVYNVNKTMDLMERPPEPARPLAGREAVARLRREGFLCSCHLTHCPVEGYSLARKPECPLARLSGSPGGPHPLGHAAGMEVNHEG